MQHAFLTGFPGFIAERLLPRLYQLHDDLLITALVEPSMASRAAAAAAPYGERLRIVEGDIAAERLGLGDFDYADLAGSVDAVLHLAAIYSLDVALDVAERVNVEGTGNIIDFCRACPQLERHHYISTCYVAGRRTGTVYEHELVMGQAFKNHYESTKFQAEVWVRESMPSVPTTIYRPAIVVGDSQTGETQKFDGPYFVLRAVQLAVARRTPIARFGRADALFTVVPVDFVVEAIATGTTLPEASGRTFQLADPDPLSAARLTDVLAREYAGVEPRLTLPARAVTEALRSRSVRRLYGGAPRESIAYLSHPVRFDTRQTRQVLGPHGVSCPRFTDYAANLVRFFKEHEADPAFIPPYARF